MTPERDSIPSARSTPSWAPTALAMAAAGLMAACGGGGTTAAITSSTGTPTTAPTSTGTSGTVTALDTLGVGETYSIVYASTQIGIDQRPATATFAPNNTLLAYRAAANEDLNIGTMSSFNAAGSNLVQIGRWASGSFAGTYFALIPATTVTLNPDQGWHYAIGKQTVNLPCSGSMTYTLADATPPTKQDGSHGPGTLSALTVTVTFTGPAATGAQLNATVTTTGSAVVNGSTVTVNGTSSTVTLGAQRRFNMSFTSTGGGFTGSNAYGLFAGANAEELGVAYIWSTGVTGQGVTGAARLTRTANTAVACP